MENIAAPNTPSQPQLNAMTKKIEALASPEKALWFMFSKTLHLATRSGLTTDPMKIRPDSMDKSGWKKMD